MLWLCYTSVIICFLRSYIFIYDSCVLDDYDKANENSDLAQYTSDLNTELESDSDKEELPAKRYFNFTVIFAVLLFMCTCTSARDFIPRCYFDAWFEQKCKQRYNKWPPLNRC